MSVIERYERALREIASGKVDEVLGLTEMPRRLTRKAMMRVASEALESPDNSQGAVGALAELVRLKDGPRDDAYRTAKDAAWDRARAIVGGQ